MACSTAFRVVGSTRVLPFTTRDTVARETPAAVATASRVASAATLAGLVCESALTTAGHSSRGSQTLSSVDVDKPRKRSHGRALVSAY